MTDINNETFYEQLCLGKTSWNDIDNFIDRWHASSSGVELHEYLGMHISVYIYWLEHKEECEKMINDQIQGK